MSRLDEARSFYERRAAPEGWARPVAGRGEQAALAAFVADERLGAARVLEIGCGTGEFQHLARGWVGVDLATSVARHLTRPFAAGSAEALPFRDASFDALWSIAVLEHVARPERALDELARVLKPGGAAYLAPAWHCRPWAAEGLHVRPWAELDLRQRLIKATLPLREALWFRAAQVLPWRALREVQHALAPRRPLRLRYGRLRPNYETFWCSDSDACSALDPHELALWFRSRGWRILSHPGFAARFGVRHGALVVRKP